MNDILMAKAAISTAELEFYAGNPSWTVRCEVASNWFASSELLNTLAHDFRWEVQACVAENPNTNNETFEYLLEQGRDDVLWYVAGSRYIHDCGRCKNQKKQKNILKNIS